MRKISVFDTTLRDGEQSAGVNLNFEEKMEIAKQLERLGVDIIEAGFPASSQGDFQSVKAIAETVKGSSVTGLARSVQKDIDAAWEALKSAEEPRIHLFIATSPIHMEHKLRMTPEQVIEKAVESVKYAASRFKHVQWSAEDASRSDFPFLAQIIEAVIQAGATVINLPDTVGYTTPQEIKRMFQYMKQNVPSIDKVSLSTHNHDDLGMAVANSLAAIQGGADQVECTINGIGERAGNASLEEIAVALNIRKDHYETETGLILKEIKRTSSLVSKLTGMVVPNNKAVVGANAFAHESGIHQDGVLKNKQTYEIITPEMVGVSSNSMVLGKHSGRHAFKTKVQELGFTGTDEQLNNIFKAFKDLADKKKEITEDDLFALMTEQTVGGETNHYELQTLQVNYGSNLTNTATITMKLPSGEVAEEAATGSGSVEAIYNTLERLLDAPVKLLDYRIQSITGGRDALADVYVQMDYQGVVSSGRGTAHDVLEASAKAYLNAVNRTINRKKYAEVYGSKVEV
ncbi:2-isopropylmalate synthase [Halalkalibacterium halodurans]|uniref:2-isopropylmalate synthase n=1 Tax=Halalkalibacterium halodurans (strain ATCC BAA-125 / DSM 18197 / FERM 7344 / JCM 9153 / C-125) TaxID=272558 RepID=LEU1_HALH5|nr:2-isopropylmalate synthase [Halalkalibacterium halodurans]Q9K8E8.1 RecName: Full=2-isopropylmalate synthase; AltName: Full=Alpha-IPM synthase; AltName: Full=Alpha-isopropylmalate synthase [Halalkalibacterium halodurans C-125]MED4082187.1 2-isopropylmalate synthase [Halalkalibacterium halodurans]MED4084494.1 2-isopropylmalate synthase [Halalkalibacterium halodurans]MED4103688.1 2-isopropylmalate synthase [Halalkalibacterium halodurans]MED4110156.1 2-isopropylmalate synthase [Halalkalibacteri